jgi:putative membrane protein insertion efficiency factor
MERRRSRTAGRGLVGETGFPPRDRAGGEGGGRVKYLSLLLRAFAPSPGVAGLPVCKYHPSCSEYSSLALREFGLVRGTLKTAWRLLRCNPWSHGGVDYPGNQRP